MWNINNKHVRLSEQGLWLLRHSELASKVIDAIHAEHEKFKRGEDIVVNNGENEGVTISLASKIEEREKKKAD